MVINAEENDLLVNEGSGKMQKLKVYNRQIASLTTLGTFAALICRLLEH